MGSLSAGERIYSGLGCFATAAPTDRLFLAGVLHTPPYQASVVSVGERQVRRYPPSLRCQDDYLAVKFGALRAVSDGVRLLTPADRPKKGLSIYKTATAGARACSVRGDSFGCFAVLG